MYNYNYVQHFFIKFNFNRDIVLTSSVSPFKYKTATKFEKILSFIIVTPSIHWVHHHKRQKETDANYVQF